MNKIEMVVKWWDYTSSFHPIQAIAMDYEQLTQYLLSIGAITEEDVRPFPTNTVVEETYDDETDEETENEEEETDEEETDEDETEEETEDDDEEEDEDGEEYEEDEYEEDEDENFIEVLEDPSTETEEESSDDEDEETDEDEDWENDVDDYVEAGGVSPPPTIVQTMWYNFDL